MEPVAAAISIRVTPARARRSIALGLFMGTNCNRDDLACQLRVTHHGGNLVYPLDTFVTMSQSQPLRRTFDTVKARQKMEAAGISYADLGRALGYERQAVGHWFRDRGEPNLQQMKVMAETLGCHWLELATEETMVVHREDELGRLSRIRQLDEAALAELDAFLAFKASSSGT